MHHYEHLVAADDPTPPPGLASSRFRDPHDLDELAKVDRLLGGSTCPEAWHLDAAGRFRCGYRGSSIESIRDWADDPYPLRRSRREGLASVDGCTDRWLIVESRPTWTCPSPTVTEADAAAFVRVRRVLADLGVHLLDCMVFDDRGHWWSLHELTSGSLRWDLDAAA